MAKGSSRARRPLSSVVQGALGEPTAGAGRGATEPGHPHPAALTAELGAEIRALRRAAGWTSVELAGRAGLSTAMLSRIEGGAAAPSLGSMAALADALSVPLARLFASHDRQRDCSYVAAGKGVRIERQASRAGHVYELLGHSLSSEVLLEPYLVTLGDDAQPHPSFQHAGTEMLHVLRGRMMYRYQGKLYDLRPGDSLVFDANAVHGPEELLERPIVYLSIVVNARK